MYDNLDNLKSYVKKFLEGFIIDVSIFDSGVNGL